MSHIISMALALRRCSNERRLRVLKSHIAYLEEALPRAYRELALHELERETILKEMQQ